MNTQVEDPATVHKKNLYKVIFLSLGFMTLYAAFSTTQDMISQIYYQLGYENLGNYALFALYLTQAANNLFAPTVVQKLPAKWVLVFSSLGYIPFLVVGILPTKCYDYAMEHNEIPSQMTGICSKSTIYGFILASAALTGYCASLIWVAQGTFIGVLSSSRPDKTGVYFGIFCSIFATSFLIGSVISTFLLGYTTKTTFFIIMTIIGGAACITFAFTPIPYSNQQQAETKASKLKQYEDNPQQQQQQTTSWTLSTIRRYQQILKTKKILPLMALMGLSGTILAFYAGYMYTLIQGTLDQGDYSDEAQKEVSRKTCYVYICQGISQIVSGYLGAIMAQKYNIYRLVNFATILIQIAFIFALIATYSQDYSLVFITSAFIGFGDNLLNTIFSEIITRDYQGKSEIYALKSFVMSLVFAVLLLINILVKHEAKYSFILAIFVYQIISNIASVHLGPQAPLSNLQVKGEFIEKEDKESQRLSEDKIVSQEGKDPSRLQSEMLPLEEKQ